jgi:hypothetical protein
MRKFGVSRPAGLGVVKDQIILMIYDIYSKYVIYLESIDFQGLLHCFSGIITIPGFFSGIITLFFRDYYCTWILFRDCYYTICPSNTATNPNLS